MDPIIESLQPPVLLVAMPQVRDPFFFRSVVLLLEQTANGSFGVIVNRPTELTVASLLFDLEIEWKGSAAMKAFFGGPVQSNVGSSLFAGLGQDIDELDDRIVAIAPGLRLSQDVRVLKDLAVDPPAGFRFILGCAGWESGQLEQELGRNDWLLVPFEASLLFEQAPQEMWAAALRSIGVRPESLSSSNVPESGEAN
ncbi:MAG: YqgE/AlgH family protein [Acidobacteriota bacterium]